MSHDTVASHREGEMTLESVEEEFTESVTSLPRRAAKPAGRA